jgi:hypothetical protein
MTKGTTAGHTRLMRSIDDRFLSVSQGIRKDAQYDTRDEVIVMTAPAPAPKIPSMPVYYRHAVQDFDTAFDVVSSSHISVKARR